MRGDRQVFARGLAIALGKKLQLALMAAFPRLKALSQEFDIIGQVAASPNRDRVAFADAYPLLDAWIRDEAEAYWANPVAGFSDTHLSRAAVDMYKMVGLLPIGDTPRFGGSQYVSDWWRHTDLETKRR